MASNCTIQKRLDLELFCGPICFNEREFAGYRAFAPRGWCLLANQIFEEIIKFSFDFLKFEWTTLVGLARHIFGSAQTAAEGLCVPNGDEDCGHHIIIIIWATRCELIIILIISMYLHCSVVIRQTSRVHITRSQREKIEFTEENYLRLLFKPSMGGGGTKSTRKGNGGFSSFPLCSVYDTQRRVKVKRAAMEL